MLKSSYSVEKIEAGCDEAGRGCLAGPVVAAAVILPKDYQNSRLNDSKKLSRKARYELREVIINEAQDWKISFVDNGEIDQINILNASFLAMHRAIAALSTKPELLLIDGNRFKPYTDIPHQCIVKGDGKYLSIAAASILAKTTRDDYMILLAKKFPHYGWENNMGYPTTIHRQGIRTHGTTPLHRMSFQLLPSQTELFD